MTIVVRSEDGYYHWTRTCAEGACAHAYSLKSNGAYFRSGGRDPFSNRYWEYRMKRTNTILRACGLEPLQKIELPPYRSREVPQTWAFAPPSLCSRPLLHAMMRLHRDGGNFLESILAAVATVQAAHPRSTRAAGTNGSEWFLGTLVHPAVWCPILFGNLRNKKHLFKPTRLRAFIQSALVWDGDAFNQFLEQFQRSIGSRVLFTTDNFTKLHLENGRTITNYSRNILFGDGYRIYCNWIEREMVTEKTWRIGGYQPF